MMPQRIAGSVTRRKVCNGRAPSVDAACSCSVPISRSTGITSRATKGSEAKIVAITIPGIAKMIGSPWLMNHEPNQPCWP